MKVSVAIAAAIRQVTTATSISHVLFPMLGALPVKLAGAMGCSPQPMSFLVGR